MDDDLRLRVAKRLAQIACAKPLLKESDAVDVYNRLADAILPLLDNPLIDKDDWERWHTAREKFLGEAE